VRQNFIVSHQRFYTHTDIVLTSTMKQSYRQWSYSLPLGIRLPHSHILKPR